MIQTREDTAEVTDSVTVAVGEGPRIHLIEDGVGPPLRARGPGSFGHANPLCRGWNPQNGELTIDCAAISR